MMLLMTCAGDAADEEEPEPGCGLAVTLRLLIEGGVRPFTGRPLLMRLLPRRAPRRRFPTIVLHVHRDRGRNPVGLGR